MRQLWKIRLKMNICTIWHRAWMLDSSYIIAQMRQTDSEKCKEYTKNNEHTKEMNKNWNFGPVFSLSLSSLIPIVPDVCLSNRHSHTWIANFIYGLLEEIARVSPASQTKTNTHKRNHNWNFRRNPTNQHGIWCYNDFFVGLPIRFCKKKMLMTNQVWISEEKPPHQVEQWKYFFLQKKSCMPFQHHFMDMFPEIVGKASFKDIESITQKVVARRLVNLLNLCGSRVICVILVARYNCLYALHLTFMARWVSFFPSVSLLYNVVVKSNWPVVWAKCTEPISMMKSD